MAVLQIFQEAGLIDRHQRPQSHRHRRKLPEIRHQPRVRITRQALAAGLLPEAEELLLAQPPLEKSARVDAGRAVPLHEDQIAAMTVGRCVPEMAKADVVERGSRLEARDMAAELRTFLVGTQNDGQRIPPDDRAKLVLDRAIAR